MNQSWERVLSWVLFTSFESPIYLLGLSCVRASGVCTQPIRQPVMQQMVDVTLCINRGGAVHDQVRSLLIPLNVYTL